MSKHTHMHVFLRDGKKVVHERKVTDYFKSPNHYLESFIKGLHIDFLEYQKHYASYEEGDTEYLRFEGTINDSNHFALTVDSWSCYCEPLNENQEPPF